MDFAKTVQKEIKHTMINDYDPIIKSAAATHLPGTDWRLVKAQLFQESRLNTNAVSPVGAQGIAQFMPGTWADMTKQMRMPADASPFDPDFAIPAMCHYMAKLYKEWSAPRPAADRYALTLASYNAGMGNILKAQKLAQKMYGINEANAYYRIISALHLVTGYGHSRETREYVAKIYNYFTSLIIEGI
jgi:soluble lytic murein transglycosylase-like protein